MVWSLLAAAQLRLARGSKPRGDVKVVAWITSGLGKKLHGGHGRSPQGLVRVQRPSVSKSV